MSPPALSLRQDDSQGDACQHAITPPASAGHFIPIRHADLIDVLCDEAREGGDNHVGLRQLADLLSATLHFEYHQQLSALKSDYAPFDPDADTRPIVGAPASARQLRLDGLFERFGWLLERANFTQLSQADIDAALAGSSQWGLSLEVDFDVFERLAIYVRGSGVIRRSRRGLKTLWKTRTEQADTYQRLVVILKLRENRRTTGVVDTQDVYLKLFKDIPQMDLEMLLPGTRVRMSLLDRTKILLPTLSGLALTSWKLISGAVAVAAAGMVNVLTLLGLVGGSVGYGLRSFHGYLQTKQRYQLNLTESLYYQNLDNNCGVLMRLVDEAEEQENREALLAYYFLWRHAPATGWNAEELDGAVEVFLQEKLGEPVDFEVADALEKLTRFGMITQTPLNKFRAVPLDAALGTLDASWDQFFQYSRAA